MGLIQSFLYPLSAEILDTWEPCILCRYHDYPGCERRYVEAQWSDAGSEDFYYCGSDIGVEYEFSKTRYPIAVEIHRKDKAEKTAKDAQEKTWRRQYEIDSQEKEKQRLKKLSELRAKYR